MHVVEKYFLTCLMSEFNVENCATKILQEWVVLTLPLVSAYEQPELITFMLNCVFNLVAFVKICDQIRKCKSNRHFHKS